jgi:hypothetical protein
MRTIKLVAYSLITLCLAGITTAASAMAGYNDCDFADLHRFATPGLSFTAGKMSKAVPFKPAVLFEAGGPCVGLEATLCTGPADNVMARNQAVIVAFERGDSACVIFQQNDGFASGWVEKRRVNTKKAKPMALADWQGVWHTDQGRTKADITIMNLVDFAGKYRAQQAHPDPESIFTLLTYDPSKREGLDAQSLGLTGYSVYTFDTIGGTDTHLGMFTATPRYNGPVLLYDEAVEDRHGTRETDCLVVMLNFGETLAVTDQGRCGGESVRFNGTFNRTKATSR